MWHADALPLPQLSLPPALSLRRQTLSDPCARQPCIDAKHPHQYRRYSCPPWATPTATHRQPMRLAYGTSPSPSPPLCILCSPDTISSLSSTMFHMRSLSPLHTAYPFTHSLSIYFWGVHIISIFCTKIAILFPLSRYVLSLPPNSM
jgi:hypothetical protein